MAHEQKSFGKQFEELGIKLTLLQLNADKPSRYKKDESERKIDSFILECYEHAAVNDSYFAKIQLTYLKAERYRLTYAEKNEIKKLGESPTASPEDRRNLELCYFTHIDPPQNFYTDLKSKKKSLMLEAANQGDAYALHCLAEDFDEMYRGIISIDILKKAAKCGSICATHSLLWPRPHEDLAPAEIEEYKKKLTELKKERADYLANAPTMIKQIKEEIKNTPWRAFEFILCSSLPLEVTAIIVSMLTFSDENRSISTLIKSLSSVLAPQSPQISSSAPTTAPQPG